MKVALVTTTINVPHVLKLYRALSLNTRFFIAGDRKLPEGAVAFMSDLGDALYLGPHEQEKWKCSEPIGWNCIQRRNIATLEALRWGADIIVSVDDDNFCVGSYFDSIERALSIPFHGLMAKGYGGWFDSGQLLIPPTRQRGIPHDKALAWQVAPIVGAKVGVAAGMVLGDTDMDAVTRIAHSHAPQDVHSCSELLRHGIVVDPNCFTVFNSQNTAFLRELAPCMFMIPHVGRFDDIFASIITRRVMRDHGLYTHFGPPFVWQQRNPHRLMRDLQDEMLGLEHVDEFARMVDRFPHASEPLIPFLRKLYTTFPETGDWWPEPASIAADAWLDDCETVMK